MTLQQYFDNTRVKEQGLDLGLDLTLKLKIVPQRQKAASFCKLESYYEPTTNSSEACENLTQVE